MTLSYESTNQNIYLSATLDFPLSWDGPMSFLVMKLNPNIENPLITQFEIQFNTLYTRMHFILFSPYAPLIQNTHFSQFTRSNLNS